MGHSSNAASQASPIENANTVDFVVAGIAHESRNALQRIRARVDLMRSGVAHDPQLLDDLDAIEEATRGLQFLFDELREFRAPIHLVFERCRLCDVVQRAWQQLDAHPAHGNATFSMPQQDFNCSLDVMRMEQVFRNLFENSLSACDPSAHIKVHWVLEQCDGNTALRISVRDNGSGFSRNNLEHAFEPFYTTKRTGTGLGLAIIKRIVESHLGQIFIDPHVTDGACVVIVLPMSAISNASQAVSTASLNSASLMTA